jgi:hypothetical protein
LILSFGFTEACARQLVLVNAGTFPRRDFQDRNRSLAVTSIRRAILGGEVPSRDFSHPILMAMIWVLELCSECAYGEGPLRVIVTLPCV